MVWQTSLLPCTATASHQNGARAVGCAAERRFYDQDQKLHNKDDYLSLSWSATAPSIAAADFYCCFIDDLLCFNSGHNFSQEEDKLQYQKIQDKIKQYPWELLLIKIELLTIKQESNIGDCQC